ncbi:MAG TPA: AI-2E family transporter [Candidatus Limnocylindrales bacterium]|nr:AI-2E family transporter [Candidatus Limnocylindrales bacterium]
MANDTRTTSSTDQRAARKAYSARRWAELRDNIASTTPQAIGRALLTIAVVGGSVWVAVATWPTLLPFLIGGLIAYMLLPVVDALDGVMPRVLAAAVSVLGVVAAIVGIAVIVGPPLVRAFARLAVDLPSSADIDAALQQARAQLESLSNGSAEAVIPILATLAATARDVMATLPERTDTVTQQLLGILLNTLGAVLGLIVLPTWMLSVMSEQRRGRMAVDRQLAPWLRRDLWAVVAIIDRAVGSYLRGYVLAAGLVGVLTYFGLIATSRLGGPTFQEPLALAVLAGATQVVPVVGPIAGALPALLILPISPERAAAYFVIYLAARIIGTAAVGARLRGRYEGVPPVILVPGVVVLGQFGLLWLLLSAPILTVAADIVRYLHARLSEPPLPAGVLPRTAGFDKRPTAVTARVPNVYRNIRRGSAAAGSAGATVSAPAGRG